MCHERFNPCAIETGIEIAIAFKQIICGHGSRAFCAAPSSMLWLQGVNITAHKK